MASSTRLLDGRKEMWRIGSPHSALEQLSKVNLLNDATCNSLPMPSPHAFLSNSWLVGTRSRWLCSWQRPSQLARQPGCQKYQEMCGCISFTVPRCLPVYQALYAYHSDEKAFAQRPMIQWFGGMLPIDVEWPNCVSKVLQSKTAPWCPVPFQHLSTIKPSPNCHQSTDLYVVLWGATEGHTIVVWRCCHT